MKKNALLYVAIHALATSACANLGGLLAVGDDIGKIAKDVYADVVAHKPFEQVLADTGTDDAALLVAILTAVAKDPKLSEGDRKKCWNACKPYIDQANTQLAAAKTAEK